MSMSNSERELKLKKDAAVGAIARVLYSAPTVKQSDIRYIAKTAYAYGYEKAKQERIDDIRLFEKYDEDEEV